MKQKLPWILFLILLAAIALVLVGRRSPFGKKNTSFASKPKTEITKIVFSENSKDLTLENKDGRWLLNGDLDTRKRSISYVLGILKGISIKSPVSPEMFDTAVVKKGIEPVRVRTYEGRKLLSDFLVFKTRSNIYGNIMKTGPGAKPFIMYVPGHDADIGSVFSTNGLYWQPYTIFNIMPSEITSVRFENINDPSLSFAIIKERELYTLTDGQKTLAGFDTVLVKRYLTYFTFIPFEAWEFEMDDADTQKIISASPAYRINVQASEGRGVALFLWERRNPDGSADSDRMYGKLDTIDRIFIVRYFDIDPVLKKKEYFFGGD